MDSRCLAEYDKVVRKERLDKRIKAKEAELAKAKLEKAIAEGKVTAEEAEEAAEEEEEEEEKGSKED